MSKTFIKILAIAAGVIVVLGLACGLAYYFLGFGQLTVTTTPANASVVINGVNYQPKTTISLRPGRYDVVVSANGYASYTFHNYRINMLQKYTLKRVLANNNEAKLQATLPYDDGTNFTLAVRDTGEKYIYDIGLYAILNGPDQAASYQEQLKALKPDALNYIKGFGVNPSSIDINWLQSEAKSL